MFERNYIANQPIEKRFSIEKGIHDYYPQVVKETIEPVEEIKVDEKKEKRNSRRAIKKSSK